MALLGKTVTYELQGLEDTHWIIDSVHNNKADVLPAAEQLVEANLFDAVRVMQEIQGEEKIIFEKKCRKQSSKPITLSFVDNAPLCKSTPDIFRFNARLATVRLLRKYLDDKGLTSIELFTGLWTLKELQRNETLYNQALQRISTIQGRIEGEDASVRYDFLVKMAGLLVAQAQKAGDTSEYQKILKKSGASALLKELDKKPAAFKDFLFWSVTASLLNTKADWRNKLDIVLNLIELDSSNETLARLDSIIAEIMDGAEASREIIGPQKDLGTSLINAALLSRGRYKPGPKQDDNEPIVKLSRILLKHNLPYTRAVLFERINNGISSIHPLTREDDAADQSVFSDLAISLISNARFLGGSQICESFTMRARILFAKDGEDLDPTSAIQAMLKLLSAPIVQLGYLADLGNSEFGTVHQKTVVEQMGLICGELVKSEKPIMQRVPPKHTDIAAKGLRRRLQSKFLDTPEGQSLVNTIEGLLKSTTVTAEKVEQETEEVDTDFIDQSPNPQQFTPPKNQTTRDISKGDYIFRAGDLGDAAYLVAAGEVEILLETTTESRRIGLLSRGELFGEMALIDQGTRMASARATMDTILTVISDTSFRKHLDKVAQSDRVMRRLLDVFVERLRSMAD